MSTQQAVAQPNNVAATPGRRPALDRTPTASQRTEARLKAERVQEKLQSMPGWSALQGHKAVDRVRDLSDPVTAAAWAGFVAMAAASQQQRVGVEMSGTQVTVTVYGRIGRRDGVTLEDLDFAKQLG